MIFIFSNRNIENDNWLGDGFHPEGNETIRIAELNADDRLDFYDENEEGTPSVKVFEAVEKNHKPCCLFVHGFNQSLKKNIKKCKEIEAYGVNVIAFSWPSNPGPDWLLPTEYSKARKNAERSVTALRKFFELFNDYYVSEGKLNRIRSLVVHSLGNYLLQLFVSGPAFENQLHFLKNIILHQADVDSIGHEKWVDKLTLNSSVLATINASDDVLNLSDIINPDRLGNTLENLNSEKTHYFNFGKIPEADNQHRLWKIPTIDNENAKAFFAEGFKGMKIDTGNFDYDSGKNCFHIK